MAELIRLKNPPEKWIFKKMLNQTHRHYLSAPYICDLRNRMADHDSRTQIARNLITNHIAQKEILYKKAQEKSCRNYQYRLAVKILLFAANWIRSIDEEAVAIKSIAHATCRAITGESGSIGNPLSHDKINKKIASFMSVHLLIPKSLFSDIKNKYEHLLTIFNWDDFYRYHREENVARLEMHVCQEIIGLDFSSVDVDRVLAAVGRNL